MIVIKRTGGAVDMKSGRDLWYHEEAAKVSPDCAPEEMGAAMKAETALWARVVRERKIIVE